MNLNNCTKRIRKAAFVKEETLIERLQTAVKICQKYASKTGLEIRMLNTNCKNVWGNYDTSNQKIGINLCAVLIFKDYKKLLTGILNHEYAHHVQFKRFGYSEHDFTFYEILEEVAS